MSVSCIVMASGMSKRMGTNKLLLELNGKMLFEYILDSIEKTFIDEVVVVTRFKEIKQYAKKMGFIVVENEKYNIGQSSSIKLGVERANENNDYMFFVADQPNVTPETIGVLLEERDKNKGKIILPYYDNKKGNPVIFPNILRTELLNISGDSGGSKVIFENENIIKKVYFEHSENIDIDTLEDYEKIRRQYER